MLTKPCVHIVAKQEVFFAAASADTPGLIQRLAREEWGADSWCRASSIPFQVLFYIRGGQAKASTGRWAGTLRPGMVFCCGPGQAHEIRCSAPHTLKVLLVTLVGADAMMRQHLGNTNLVIVPRNPAPIADIFATMMSVAQVGLPTSRSLCEQYVPLLLESLSRCLAEQSGGRNPSPAVTLRRCKEYLDANYARLRSAKEAADVCGISQEYMCRLFRDTLTTTPHDYLLGLKMNLACHLLHTSQASVKEIAWKLGYADQHVFSKTFRRLTGSSAREYRAAGMVPQR